ncbi:hybrid sensor histidine kinase/response regulator [Bacteroides sp.]|uniref:hybrid sensor histidine kinase/response regulator n=1 Tax=Bacteroides sp. TaxID=29523 RepID=UPI0023D44138|nr:hybrid sensor histidine kinase/response regulator [Bacteroides sp.]MDE6214919.1 hybrid sensor histidine kinase/response regulator [Bacteroides sp.]
MKSVSKVKIGAGYALLLAALFFSLFFVHREMENLMRSDSCDVQWTDSLLALLREKDANTIKMLRTSGASEGTMLSEADIEQILARQDSAVIRQRVQHRVIAHRDTVVTPVRKKGFFRRLGEVFAPPRKDTVIRVNTSLEYATDTLLAPYNPADSLHEELRAVARQKRAVHTAVQRRKRDLQRRSDLLAVRIDSLLKEHEAETLLRARAEATYRQEVRHRSVRTIGGIAAGALLLSVLFLVVIGRDITRSNRYRRELEEARRRAEELLAVREKLMLAITHDFKAPLGSIIGYADLLVRLVEEERQRLYVNHIRSSSEHLLKLVTDLLDFHSLELNKVEVRRVAFRPLRLLEEVCAGFQPLVAAKGLAFHCDMDSRLAEPCTGDPLRLRQVVDNLLSNAVKFTERGSITLTARYEGCSLVIAVADTGKGMQPADCERIFREFTRLPDAQGKEGFGLGLSIVRMLVQLLGGTIWVDSVPGKGSTFTLCIPTFLNEEPVDNEESGRNEELRMKHEEWGCAVMPQGDSSFQLKRLLLIDDDRIQLTLTAAMLRQGGIDSVSCLQPDELLDALRTDTFDALLTDVQMPAMNGFDLLALLRASNIPQACTLPVIAVTARSDMRREEFVAHGFAGCLHKPFTVGELLGELEQAVDAPAAEVPDSPKELDFSSLTAFSAGDPKEAKSIVESFLAETRLHAARLRKAVECEEVEELAAVSHKMIPLFTLIGATEAVALMRLLESSREAPFTNELKAHALSLLACIEEVKTQAQSFFAALG